MFKLLFYQLSLVVPIYRRIYMYIQSHDPGSSKHLLLTQYSLYSEPREAGTILCLYLSQLWFGHDNYSNVNLEYLRHIKHWTNKTEYQRTRDPKTRNLAGYVALIWSFGTQFCFGIHLLNGWPWNSSPLYLWCVHVWLCNIIYIYIYIYIYTRK